MDDRDCPIPEMMVDGTDPPIDLPTAKSRMLGEVAVHHGRPLFPIKPRDADPPLAGVPRPADDKDAIEKLLGLGIIGLIRGRFRIARIRFWIGRVPPGAFCWC